MGILGILKQLGLNLLNRLKPRATFRWIFSAVIWILILIYLGYGIYFSFQIYKYENESRVIKLSTYIYPFPAAVVNGKIVWASSYYQQLTYIEQFYSALQKPIDKTDLKAKIIDKLAENQIIEFQALRYNVHVSNQEFADAYQQVVDQAGGEVNLKKVLNTQYGMSEREFKALVMIGVLKEKIQNNLMVQVKVAHILIKNEKTANDVFAQTKTNNNFGDLAKKYSEDLKSRDAGGELGWLGKGQLVVDGNPLTEFDTAAFAAKSGDIVGPIKTTAGFEIVKIEDKKGVIDDSFDHWLSILKSQAKVWKWIK